MFLNYALAGCGLIIATSVTRQDKYKEFCVAVGLVIAAIAIAPLVAFTHFLYPRTLDACLLLIDRHLRLDGYGLARIVYGTPPLKELLVAAYGAVPLAIAVAWIVEHSDVMLWALVTATVTGPFLYFIVPAAGPLYAFPGFPWTTPKVRFVPIPVAQAVPRNCFPSLHFSWALLVYMNVRTLWLRALCLVFLLLTALATVGSGQHYFIDLLAAVPFCIAVQWAAEARLWRQACPRRAPERNGSANALGSSRRRERERGPLPEETESEPPDIGQ